MSARPAKRRADVGGTGASGGATPAVRAAREAGIAHVVHGYDRPAGAATGYGAEAVAALGVDAERVHKTLVADAGGRLVVAVVAVSARLDLRALAAAVGARRAVLAELGVAERATGYVAGGISPLGQRRALTTVVDRRALDHATIHVSAGRRGLELELDPRDLVRLTGASTARISG